MSIYFDKRRVLTDADNLSGRNYLLNTSNPISLTGENRIGQVAGTFASTTNDLSSLYTFSIEMLSDSTSGRVYIGNQPHWYVYHYFDLQKGLNRISFSTHLQTDFKGLLFSIDNSTAKFTIQNVRLNKGSVAADWSPAPEDLVLKSDFDALKAQVDSLTKSKNGGVLAHHKISYVPLMEVA